MYFFATAIAALAACHTASAWSISIFNRDGCTTMPGTNPEELMRDLSQDGPSDCNVFGQDMPGVSCVQWLPAARNPRPCLGDLPAKSLFVNSGSSCTLYNKPDCSTEGEITTVSGQSEGVCSENEEGFKAYKCWDDTA